MSDLDIINSVCASPIRPPDHVSLEEIIASIPCMGYNNPATFALYLHYNKKHLEADETNKVNAVIEKLKLERSAANRKNIQYMERHKDMKELIEETE